MHCCKATEDLARSAERIANALERIERILRKLEADESHNAVNLKLTLGVPQKQ